MIHPNHRQKKVKTHFQTRMVKIYISKIFPLWLLTYCQWISSSSLSRRKVWLLFSSQLSWLSRMKLEIMTNTSVAPVNLPNSRCGHDGPLISSWIVRGKVAPEFCLSSIIGAPTPTHRSSNSLRRYLHDMSSVCCFLCIDMVPSSLLPSSCQFL